MAKDSDETTSSKNKMEESDASKDSGGAKRKAEEMNEEGSSDEDVVGPAAPSDYESSAVKRKKYLEHEELYIENLPMAEFYEKSYMHRDHLSFIVVTKADFIITASCDGHVKFWKKMEEGIEFVKHFRAHLGNIQCVSVNGTGSLFCTVSNDKSVKVFDVLNFDMINMVKLGYVPACCEWVHCPGDATAALAIAEAESHKIYIYDGHGTNVPIHTLENIHRSPILAMKFNPKFEAVVSVDEKGMIEYWTGPKHEYAFPKNLSFDSKLDTDLFEFVQSKTTLLNLCVSPNGQYFAGLTSNRKICIFKFATGKLTRVFDENLANVYEIQQKKQLIPHMEFGRRMAIEKEIEKNGLLKTSNIIFDESSNFILYPTVLGVKVVNIVTNRLVKIIGRPETLRFLYLALFQGKAKRFTAATTAEFEAAENPTIDSILPDPTLFCTAYKKNRFYLFSKRESDDPKSGETDRDIFNEKPTKEDIIAATDATVGQKIYNTAVIHTTKGDITINLFGKECPKTVENFCVHARNGYYNGHIFHRVIKGFMIQTGDPTGVGTGGESIWGGEFEDEFHPSLKHDRPYTVSMANAGPNTNGSQFFINVIPTPWLDNKHTVFARVTRGMETVQNISIVKTNPKTDKPYDDISIVNITLR